MIEAFLLPFVRNDFIVNAFFASSLVAICCAVAGTFMVLRGMAFMADALSHGVLPGVATAILVGAPTLLGAAAGSLVMLFGIHWVTKKTRLSTDSAIGLLFVGMLALGVVIVSRSSQFSGDLMKILFGELLGVSSTFLVQQFVATCAIVALAAAFHRPLLLLCFSPDQAHVSGFSPRRYNAVLLAIVVTAVMVSFKTVGTLLVFGMLVAPAATAALLTRKIVTMMTVAAGIGIGSTYLGLLLSYHFDWAAGASIVLVAIGAFFATAGFRAIVQPKKVSRA